MKRTILLASIVGLFGLGFILLNSPVMADKGDGDKGEEEIALTQLPKPIRNALKNLKVGQISEIERKRSGKTTTYEVELRVGKDEVELTLSPDGKLLAIEIEPSHEDDDDKPQKGKDKKRGDDK